MADTHDTPNSSDPAHRVDDLLTSIRAALAQDATSDVRSTGALACRTILGVLDPSSRVTTHPASATPSSPSSPLAAALG
ncbi:MAG TPA: hypothetical protein VFT22_46100, partial [Kofleriaceae bacterium]|nr:hypothetical protein [Kofleriaceae bacterium]